MLDPRVLGDLRLSRAMLVVYEALLSHASDWNLTRAGIERMTRLNKRTIGRALNDLEAIGYIRREAIDGKEGQWNSTVCVVERSPRIPDLDGDSESGSGELEVSSKCAAGGLGTPTPGGLYAPRVGVCRPPLIDINTNRETDITPYSPPEGDGRDGGEIIPAKNPKGSYSDSFEAFWKQYPRRVDKKRAYRAWVKALEESGEDHIFAQARAYSSLCQLRNTETRFIRHPSTFLNNVADASYDEELSAQRRSGNRGYSASVNPFDDLRRGESFAWGGRVPEGDVVDAEVEAVEWM